MMALITSLLPSIVRVITWWLNAQEDNSEAKKSWDAFIKEVAKLPNASARLRSDYKNQI